MALYYLAGDPPPPDFSKASPTQCATPGWALGRDAINIFSVEVLSKTIKTSKYDGTPYEEAKVRSSETLKGEAPWPIRGSLNAYPYSGEIFNPPPESPEQMIQGRRYLVLVRYPFSGFESEPAVIDGLPGIRLDRCGVLDDTPQNRAELARGFAENDNLRVPEF